MDLSVTLIDKSIKFADKNEMKVYENRRIVKECYHVKFGALPHVPDEKTAAPLPVEQHPQALTDSDAKEIPNW